MADWSNLEVDLIIEDYFQMLQQEIAGRGYSKAEHRAQLLPLLNNRNDGSIEFKHQNISAVLVNYGLPYISGYKPRGNYQKLLEEKVLAFVNRPTIEKEFEAFVEQTVEVNPQLINYDTWLTDPPTPNTTREQPKKSRKVTKRNYLELEQKNRSIGFAGEKLVYEYEKWRLTKAGFLKLANEVEWTSKEKGDGAGYDILSKKVTGEPMFIEVKTTTLGKDAPIFFTKTENDFAIANKNNFHLYRVFNVKSTPKMFFHNGSFADICTIEAASFKGTF